MSCRIATPRTSSLLPCDRRYRRLGGESVPLAANTSYALLPSPEPQGLPAGHPTQPIAHSQRLKRLRQILLRLGEVSPAVMMHRNDDRFAEGCRGLHGVVGIHGQIEWAAHLRTAAEQQYDGVLIVAEQHDIDRTHLTRCQRRTPCLVQGHPAGGVVATGRIERGVGHEGHALDGQNRRGAPMWGYSLSKYRRLLSAAR